MAKEKNKKNTPRISNKKARRDYEILETLEAGMSLQGSEVKSLRLGNADLGGSYIRINNGRCYMVGSKIEQYKQASYNNHLPDRDRELLLHKAQIRKLAIKLEQRGFSLVPLTIYFNERGLAKVQIALARGKKLYDKRQSLKDKDLNRELQRSVKGY